MGMRMNASLNYSADSEGVLDAYASLSSVVTRGRLSKNKNKFALSLDEQKKGDEAVEKSKK